jgi:esterase/lipase
MSLNKWIPKLIGFYINTLSYLYPKEAVRLTEKFISEPKKGKLTPEELPNILKESTQKTLYYKNLPIQTYIWEGNDDVILLAHGWESNAARWYLLIPILRKSNCTIVALDAPAHGLSGSKWFNVAKYSYFLEIVINHFNPKYVIGHSIGGTASLFHQYKHQTPSIKKIVLLGSPGELEKMVGNFAFILGLKKRIIRLTNKKFFKDHNISFENFSLAKMVKSINTKGLIAHDKTDRVVHFNESKAIANQWEDVVFIPTKGLGHGLQNEELYTKVYQFLFENSIETV